MPFGNRATFKNSNCSFCVSSNRVCRTAMRRFALITAPSAVMIPGSSCPLALMSSVRAFVSSAFCSNRSRRIIFLSSAVADIEYQQLGRETIDVKLVWLAVIVDIGWYLHLCRRVLANVGVDFDLFLRFHGAPNITL